MIVEWEFAGEVWYWRGPAPWYFVSVPDDVCLEIQDEGASVSYGWGMIPVTVRIGVSDWTTSLWPKDGVYIVPIKAGVRSVEQVGEGDMVTVQLGLVRD